MGDNDRGYHHPDAIDKGIKHVDVNAGTEWPPSILGVVGSMRRTPSVPDGVVQGPAITSAAGARQAVRK
jgi:hypothetical protein